MRSLRSWAFISMLAALAFTACTADSSTSTPSEEDTPRATDLAFSDDSDEPLIDQAPETTLDEDASLIRFEAVWLCELQRRTFATPDAVDTALADALGDAGLDQAKYEQFRDRVERRSGAPRLGALRLPGNLRTPMRLRPRLGS